MAEYDVDIYIDNVRRKIRARRRRAKIYRWISAIVCFVLGFGLAAYFLR